jgi:hypothetical protein
LFLISNLEEVRIKIQIGAKVYEIIAKQRRRRGKVPKTRTTSEKNILVKLVNYKELGLIEEPAPFPIFENDFKRLLKAQTQIIKINDSYGNETEINNTETEKTLKDQFTKG